MMRRPSARQTRHAWTRALTPPPPASQAIAMGDTRAILDKLQALVGAQRPETVRAFVHHGAPKSKARAKRGWSGRAGVTTHAYVSDATVEAQAAIEDRFRSVIRDAPPLSCNVAVVAVFYRPDRRRIDGDNLMKLVLDAGTKAGVWIDDSQVTAQAPFIELDPKYPRTVVAWCVYTCSMVRERVPRICRVCGKPRGPKTCAACTFTRVMRRVVVAQIGKAR